jgi:tetratricopeptide (TPR) repeat protein
MRDRMNRIARVPVLAVAALTLLVATTGCKQLEARDQLNKGVEAFKAAKYEEAINHFQNAVNLDPKFPMTRIFLATAYAEQVVPDLSTPDNLKKAQLAIASYKQVLAEDPSSITSLKGIAGLYFSTDNPDEAKVWQQKVMQADPKDPEAPYTVAVIDWKAAYKNAVKDITAAGGQNDDKGNLKMPKSACAAVKRDNTVLVDDGLGYLHKAIQLRPSYDEAMSYLSLMYRRKADVDCGDPTAQKADIAQADDWLQKSMGARKANEAQKEKSQSGGIVLDNTK